MDKFCIPLRDCSGGEGKRWRITSRIGDPSAIGELSIACCDKDCSHVLKYQSYLKKISESGTYYSSSNSEAIHREVDIQRKMAEIGIAPKVDDFWECQDPPIAGVIIMEAMKETLFSLLNRHSDQKIRMELVKGAIDIIAKMHAAGYYHGDLHQKNFMVSRGGKPGTYRLYLIDFGLSDSLEGNRERIEKDYSTFTTRLFYDFPFDDEEKREIRKYIAEAKL